MSRRILKDTSKKGPSKKVLILNREACELLFFELTFFTPCKENHTRFMNILALMREVVYGEG